MKYPYIYFIFEGIYLQSETWNFAVLAQFTLDRLFKILVQGNVNIYFQFLPMIQKAHWISKLWLTVYPWLNYVSLSWLEKSCYVKNTIFIVYIHTVNA